jgi:hypothetical protein
MKIVNDLFSIFLIIQIVRIDPRTSRMSLCKLLLDAAYGHASFTPFPTVEPSVTDTTDDDVDFLESKIGLKLA